MKGIIGKIKGLFPVTIANAVYVDGTNKTLADAMEEGSLGEIGKSATVKDSIHMEYDWQPVAAARPNHDCTIIGNDIVSFDKYDDGGSIAYFNLDTFARDVVKIHNFVESNNVKLQMKSCDYKYGKLLLGNGRSGYDPDFGRLYVLYEADTWKANAEIGTSANPITFENCGEYKEIDVTSLGGKTYGFWANGDDMVFVSCNLFNDVYRIQLAKGATQWDGGTFAEGTASDKYNGTWRIIDHWHQGGFLGDRAAHGGQYYKGHLYLADNNAEINVLYRCILRDNGVLEFQPISFDRQAPDGTLMYRNPDGVCIHDGKIYMQPLGSATGVSARGFLIADIPV